MLRIYLQHFTKDKLDALVNILNLPRVLILCLVSLVGLILSSESQIKSLVLVILLSPMCRKLNLGNILIVLLRNLIAFTGILWLVHSGFGYLRVESLSNNIISLLIEWIAIQFVQSWRLPEYMNEQEKLQIKSGQVLFFAISVFLYLYSFLNFPNRLATFLLGWDHLNGHLWLTSRIFQEGYIRINAQDFLGIYPKAEFPLILSFAQNSIDFQNLVQVILFLEILLSILALVTLHDLTFGRSKKEKSRLFIQIACTLFVIPIFIWFLYYGWTSLILSCSALLILSWQISFSRSKVSWYMTSFIALAAIQAWTIVAPIAAALILSSQKKLARWPITLLGIFSIVNFPSILAIINYTGISQVSEGFKSNSLLLFVVFIGSAFPILSLTRRKEINSNFRLLIISAYIGSLFVWATSSFETALPYYAIKLFALTLIYFIPFTLYSLVRIIRSERIQLTILSLLLSIIAFGNVPTSSYTYFDFVAGKNLETNWFGDNIISQERITNTQHILLFSNYVIDLNALQSVGQDKYQELFAHDSQYICEVLESGRIPKVLSDLRKPLPICNSE